jgi:hypothetical protein
MAVEIQQRKTKEIAELDKCAFSCVDGPRWLTVQFQGTP